MTQGTGRVVVTSRGMATQVGAIATLLVPSPWTPRPSRWRSPAWAGPWVQSELKRRAVVLALRGDQPVAQIAKDLGISKSCLRRWMPRPTSTPGPGGSPATSARSLSGCAVGPGCGRWRTRSSRAHRPTSRGRMCFQTAFRLVQELAADVDLDVAVTCRVLVVSRSGSNEWRARPHSRRETLPKANWLSSDPVPSATVGRRGSTSRLVERVIGFVGGCGSSRAR